MSDSESESGVFKQTAILGYQYQTHVVLAETIGDRQTMEDYQDRYILAIGPGSERTLEVLAVFDGHGNGFVARRANDLMRAYLAREFAHVTGDPVACAPEILRGAFADAHCYLRQGAGGTTALVALLIGDEMVVAHVGDSRCVASTGTYSLLQLTRDHRATELDEEKRILARGGRLSGWRINGVLGATRGLGHAALAGIVSAEPEIVVVDTSGLLTMIIATDGVWDVMSNERAHAAFQRDRTMSETAKKIINDAYDCGDSDNICVICYDFVMARANAIEE